MRGLLGRMGAGPVNPEQAAARALAQRVENAVLSYALDHPTDVRPAVHIEDRGELTELLRALCGLFEPGELPASHWHLSAQPGCVHN